jgi:hypothetical protein
MFVDWPMGMALYLFLELAGLHPAGYLAPPTAADKQVEKQVVPYLPREGDLIFYDDHSVMWTKLFALAGSGPPLHMGVVVRKPDGAWAVLEAGPDDGLSVELRDLVPRLHQFQKTYQGTITIRRCKAELTAKQSAALTKFAQDQVGKRYAVLRLLQQGTPFRVRGAMEALLAGTTVDRSSWICSELAVAAVTVAGVVDARVVPANVAYPRDLVDNARYPLGSAWHDAQEWRPRRDAPGRSRSREESNKKANGPHLP